MKRRKQIFRLLKEFTKRGQFPRVTVKGSKTGATLYEGSLLFVPFTLCDDFVLRYEETEQELVIISTTSRFVDEG